MSLFLTASTQLLRDLKLKWFSIQKPRTQTNVTIGPFHCSCPTGAKPIVKKEENLDGQTAKSSNDENEHEKFLKNTEYLSSLTLPCRQTSEVYETHRDEMRLFKIINFNAKKNVNIDREAGRDVAGMIVSSC